MKRRSILALLAVLISTPGTGLAQNTKRYLFLGHPRADRPGEFVQREVERIDYSAYDLLLLGGDYTVSSTSSRETVAYLDEIFDLSARTTLPALGNHDTANRDYFANVAGRYKYFTQEANNIAFVVLDTTDHGHDILYGELQMLADVVDGLSDDITHLIVLHHHIIWLADYPPLAHLIGSGLIAGSSKNLSGLNFHTSVYPLLLQARAKGVEVLCLAGDRTGLNSTEFFIDHTTTDGVHFIAAGCQEEMLPSLRNVVVLEHDLDAGTLSYTFEHLSDLPKIPDEPLIINEVHYDPGAEQGDRWPFVELFNRGSEPYDLSGAWFPSGITFTFPPDTIVAPGEYVVVARDPLLYAPLGGRVFAYEEDALPASVNRIWLRDSRGLEIDFVKYGESDPWPSLPSNQGPSLMLIDPRLDNSLVTSWAASDQSGGTPGAANIVPPAVESIVVGESEVTLRWDGVVPGGWYRVEHSATLDPADWLVAAPASEATGSSIEFTDPTTTGVDRRFYRLAREFP